RLAAHVLAVALVALALAEVPSFPGRFPYTAEQAARYHANDDLFAALAAHQGSERAVALGTTPRLATVHGLRTVPDYEPLALARQDLYARWVFDRPLVAAQAHASGSGPVPEPETLAASLRLLDLASTRYLAVPDVAAPTLAPALEALGMRRASIVVPRWTVFESPRTVPRAFVVYRTRSAPSDPDTALGDLSAESFNPLAESYVDGPSP